MGNQDRDDVAVGDQRRKAEGRIDDPIDRTGDRTGEGIFPEVGVSRVGEGGERIGPARHDQQTDDEKKSGGTVHLRPPTTADRPRNRTAQYTGSAPARNGVGDPAVSDRPGCPEGLTVLPSECPRSANQGHSSRGMDFAIEYNTFDPGGDEEEAFPGGDEAVRRFQQTFDSKIEMEEYLLDSGYSMDQLSHYLQDPEGIYGEK